MKTGLTKLLTLGSIALLALASCTKNDAKVTLNASGSGTLSASSTTPALSRANITDTTKVITFTTSAPKFGFNAAVTSTLQIDAAGDNWKHPVSATLGTKVYSQGYSTLDFDNLLLKLNLPAGTPATVSVRIQFALSTSEMTYSNVLSVTATPFNLTSWIYVTGIFSGWSNPGPLEDSLISATGNNVYTGIINFTNSAGPGDNEFLLLPVKGSWTNKYATNDAKGSTSSTITYNAPNNFYAPAATGYYIVTANLNTGAISFQPCDYYSVTGNQIVGGDWGIDQFMKFVNDGTNTWTSTLAYTPTANGGFKIREDADWGNSWGTPAAGSAGVGQTGVLVSDKDNNLVVTVAGTYTLTFVQAPSARANGTTITSPTAAGPPQIVAPYTFNGK